MRGYVRVMKKENAEGPDEVWKMLEYAGIFILYFLK